MRIVHLIMAHKNPQQLSRLIARLEHPNVDFFIHVDKKVSLDDFIILKKIERVFFIKHREKCTWGGYSLPLAIVSSLKEIESFHRKYDFINLLSGQDYPLVSANEIYKYLNDRIGTNFISYVSSKESKWWKEASARYERYHLTDFKFKGSTFIERWLSRLLPKRKFPLPLELYGGSKSTWWTITQTTANEITETLKNNRKLNNSLRYSWGTDEFIIATLIMNSSQRDKTVNDNLRYIDWPAGDAHAKVLEAEDFDKLISSGYLFARKFDTDYDSTVLDLIDKKIEQKPE